MSGRGEGRRGYFSLVTYHCPFFLYILDITSVEGALALRISVYIT